MEKNELMGQLFSSDSLDMIRNFKNLFDPESRLLTWRPRAAAEEAL